MARGGDRPEAGKRGTQLRWGNGSAVAGMAPVAGVRRYGAAWSACAGVAAGGAPGAARAPVAGVERSRASPTRSLGGADRPEVEARPR